MPSVPHFRRKAKKIYGPLIFSVGIFLIVLVLCVGEFFLTSGQPHVLSPLGRIQKDIFSVPSTQSQQIASINQLCMQYDLACTNIVLANDNSIQMTIEGKTIILSTTKDMHQEIASLQLTIKTLTMEGKEFAGLDFRYDKPVVSY